MTEDFLRQRRNLFVVNGIFLFCYYAKVDVSELSIIGMSFKGFGNPEAVYLFLWCAWAYFVYRFFIYFLEDELTKFKGYCEREMEAAVNPRILQIVSDKYCDLNENCLHSYTLMKRNNWVLNYQVYVGADENRSIENVTTEIRRADIWISEIIGLIRFVLFTPAVTNHLLPALLSLFTIAICGFSDWSGSFYALLT